LFFFKEIYCKALKDPAANLKLVDVDDRGAVFDIDTPEDYAHLKNL